jgi:putative membrane protein
MKKTLVLAVACGLVATAAFAQTPTPPTRQSAPARTGATQSRPPAQDFVTKVAISDMFEIQSRQLALSNEPDSDTKPFAQRMVADHQKTRLTGPAVDDAGRQPDFDLAG